MRRNGVIIKINTQKIICFALGYLICFPAISYAVTNLVAAWRPPFISTWASPLLYGSFYATLILAALQTVRKISAARILVTLFVAASFLVSTFGDRGNDQYMWTRWNDILQNPAYIFWFFSFSAFLFSDDLQDTKMLLKTLERFSYVSIILALLQYLTALTKETVPEYMTFSYNILMQTAFLIMLNFKKANWHRLTLSIVGAVLILIAGCRGALVGLLVSTAVYYLFVMDRTSTKRTVSLILITLGCLGLIIFWESILNGLADLLDMLNIPSRTVTLLASESFFADSGRQGIRSRALESLNILGHGLYGDRILLSGGYVHNMAIELLLDYGLILGTGIVIALVIVIWKGLTGASGDYRLLISALLSVGVIKLFASSSYLGQEPGFFLLLGLCLNSIRGNSKSTRCTEEKMLQNRRGKIKADV